MPDVHTPGPSSPTIPNLVKSALETLAVLRLQLTSIAEAALAPPGPLTPPSAEGTMLVPGATPGGPTSITDTSHNTWQLLPNGPSSTPTLFLNGYPDPFTGPASLAIWITPSGAQAPSLHFQRITGQWFLWSTNHWLPTTDPRQATSPEWGPPAFRAIDATSWQWLPAGVEPNYDLLHDLFADTSTKAATFLPSPIPITLRPRGAMGPSGPITFQRSDNTFLLPMWGPASPVTFQFPGLRPTFIRLWNGLRRPSNQGPASPLRTVTGTDTIAVPFTPSSFFIVELSLG